MLNQVPSTLPFFTPLYNQINIMFIQLKKVDKLKNSVDQIIIVNNYKILSFKQPIILYWLFELEKIAIIVDISAENDGLNLYCNIHFIS